jgi:predicted ferric reductase
LHWLTWDAPPAGHNPRKATLHRLPANIVRITFQKGGFRYSGGQYVFVCVPAISAFEWHPFSLSSHPQSDTVSLHVRVLGDFTKRLYDLSAK